MEYSFNLQLDKEGHPEKATITAFSILNVLGEALVGPTIPLVKVH